jgi:hypothetical protein
MARIYFKDLNIEEISNSSGVFSGRNLQVGWRHSKKTSEGFGSLSGDKNVIVGNLNVLLDPDFVDFFVKKPVTKQTNLK